MFDHDYGSSVRDSLLAIDCDREAGSEGKYGTERISMAHRPQKSLDLYL
jgi:hypothetical protein